MSFFQTAHPYAEGFDVYGDAVSVEWPETVDGPLTVHELLPLDPANLRPACVGGVARPDASRPRT